MRNLISAVAFATTLTGVGSASAQPYPSRPITMVTPFAAGGGTDTIARAMAERMKSSLGQPTIVEDVTGAGGTIAAGRVARAAPDGYTLSLGNNSSHIVPGAVFALQYDLQKDFEPVALLSTGPYVLAARKTMPANDLVGLIAWLKADPDKASMGIGGPASQVAAVLFRNGTGTRFQFVPYRGAAPAIQDLVAGQIDMIISDPVTALAQVRAGAIRAYGITTQTRLLSAPEIPTLDEGRHCPGSTSRCGMDFGCPRVRRRLLPPNSMPPSWRPWPTRQYGGGSPTWRRRFFRVSNSHRRRSAPFKGPRSKNGGRSSRRPASRRNNFRLWPLSGKGTMYSEQRLLGK
jgi:tripartite-type tricarboxylate transporter receptor subunit TctC